jgi:hypothetical protein
VGVAESAARRFPPQAPERERVGSGRREALDYGRLDVGELLPAVRLTRFGGYLS